jgi:hypothetical protein
MKSIFSENGNLTPHPESLAGSKKSEGDKNNWNDHKSMVTLWLVVLFALWVVLTAALAVTARRIKTRKTLQPPAIAVRSLQQDHQCLL